MKTYTMKQLSFFLDIHEHATKELVVKHLEGTHARKVKNRWQIDHSGRELLEAILNKPKEEADIIPIGQKHVPIHALPINTRLVLVNVEGQIVRATVKPMIRKRLKKGNLVYVDHMEGDLYTVVGI